jgi:hypothetical protein
VRLSQTLAYGISVKKPESSAPPLSPELQVDRRNIERVAEPHHQRRPISREAAFTISATDSLGNVAQNSYTLTVNSGQPVPVAVPETIHVTDKVALTLSPFVVETIHVTDTVVLTPNPFIQDAETIHVTDRVVVTPNPFIQDAETIHVTDKVVVTPNPRILITEAIHVTDQVAVTPSPLVVSGKVSVSQTGFVRNHATGIWSAAMTVTNTSGAQISGPIEVVLTGLSSNVTMVNQTGTLIGSPYIRVSVAALAPGASASVSIQFQNPSNGFITYTPVTYSRAF